MNSIQYKLIPFHGSDELVFNFYDFDKNQSSIESISETNIKSYPNFKALDNLKIILNSNKDDLNVIINSSKYKKLLKNNLKIIKDNLAIAQEIPMDNTLSNNLNNKNKLRPSLNNKK